MEAAVDGICSDVFGGKPKAKAAEPDLKVLHAKIGQLTLENDLLEGTLTKPVLMELLV
jgi:hypothetical protein